MATALTTALPDIHPVLDPLIATLADSSAAASGRDGQSTVEVQLEVEDTLNSDEWRLIGEFLNPYDYTTDTAKVAIHKALQGVLSPFLPSLTVSGAQAMPGPIKRYRLKARDVVDGEPQGALVTTAIFRAWLAGNSYFQIGNSLITGKAYLFLSTRSTTRRLHPEEKIHFQMLPIVSGTPTVRYIATFTDGTTQTNTLTLAAATALVPFAVNITLPSYAKTVDHIEFDITGLTGTAEKLTYKLISKPTPWFRQLFYVNSLGGLDHIPLTGKCEEITTPVSELFESQPYPVSQDGNTRAFNQRAIDSLILRTGWMSLDELRSLRDLLLRNDAYILDGTALRKLVLNTDAKPIQADDTYLHSLEISARYAHEETAYSRP